MLDAKTVVTYCDVFSFFSFVFCFSRLLCALRAVRIMLFKNGMLIISLYTGAIYDAADVVITLAAQFYVCVSVCVFWPPCSDTPCPQGLPCREYDSRRNSVSNATNHADFVKRARMATSRLSQAFHVGGNAFAECAS